MREHGSSFEFRLRVARVRCDPRIEFGEGRVPILGGDRGVGLRRLVSGSARGLRMRRSGRQYRESNAEDGDRGEGRGALGAAA